MDPGVRKRILMFYFAAGMNLVMALYVVSAGAGHVSGGMLGGIALVFLAFAGLNFYFAKMLRKRWEAQVRAWLAQQELNE